MLGVLFFGFLFAIAPIAIVLGGILDNYIHFYEIRDCGKQVFFNPFFYDTIFYKGYGWLFFLAIIVAGILVMYPPFLANFFRMFYVAILVGSLLFFVPTIGFHAGKWLFNHPKFIVTLITGEQKQLNVVYIGREGLHFITPEKQFPLTYRWEAIQNGEEQRCYRLPEQESTPSTPLPPDTKGAPAQEAQAVGVEPLPEKKSMFEVLMKKLFPKQ